MQTSNLLKLGSLLIFIGFAMVFLGMIITAGTGHNDFGGLIMIGPIPIVFGTSPEIASSMLLLGLLILIVYLLIIKR